MPLTPYPNGLSSFGVPLIGSTPLIPPTTGKYWWVSSATGKDNNGRGTDPDTPFATLAYAISKARAAKGDVIIIMPNHTEAIGTATYMNVNKSGLYIVGLGNRNARPTFTLGTVVGATWTVSAADCIFDNIILDMTGIDSVTVGVTVTAAGCMFRGCKFITNTASVSVVTVFSVSGARFELENCQVDGTGADTGTVAVIASAAPIDQLKVVGCDIRANCSTAIFVSASTNHITNMTILNNFIKQSNGTAKVIFSLTSSSTGYAAYNRWVGTTWANIAANFGVAASVNMNWFENYGFDDGTALVSGVLVPAAGTVA